MRALAQNANSTSFSYTVSVKGNRDCTRYKYSSTVDILLLLCTRNMYRTPYQEVGILYLVPVRDSQQSESTTVQAEVVHSV